MNGSSIERLLTEELFVIGGPDSDLDAAHAVGFGDVVGLPLVVPRSSSGIGLSLQNAALRAKVKFSYRTTTDSLPVMKNMIEAGIAYGVLPLSACRREIDYGRLRFAPIGEPVPTHRLGVAATEQLDLPRELSVKIGETIREEVTALVTSGTWRAELIATRPWNPMHG